MVTLIRRRRRRDLRLALAPPRAEDCNASRLLIGVVERTCTENDVKKAYKKLALALHPDKKCVRVRVELPGSGRIRRIPC